MLSTSSVLVHRSRRQVESRAERIADACLSHGVEEYIDNKKKLVRYKFFRDEAHGGKDAVFGLDVALMRLMNVLKSASQGYGTERRIILLHGPVGSAKSTIARQLKKGIEDYSRTPDGALFTYYWTLPGALSELACGTPESVTDFFELYRDSGGEAGGGFCNCELAGAPRDGGIALSALALLALAGFWRSGRRGGRA